MAVQKKRITRRTSIRPVPARQLLPPRSPLYASSPPRMSITESYSSAESSRLQSPQSDHKPVLPNDAGTAPRLSHTTNGVQPNGPGMKTAFYAGHTVDSNATSLYIQVTTAEEGHSSGSTGSDPKGQNIWVNVPWSQVVDRLFEQDALVMHVLERIASDPKAAHLIKQKTAGLATPDSMISSVTHPLHGGAHSSIYPPAMLQQRGRAMTTPSHSEGLHMWNTSYGNVHQAHSGNAMTDSELSDSGGRSLASPSDSASNLPTPWNLSPSHFDGLSLAPSSLLANQGSNSASIASQQNSPVVMTADHDTIDRHILEQVETNRETAEYIWSPVDASLYEMHNTRATAALQQQGAVKLVFPPHTMIIAYEKDGTVASPAFKPLHPHSNQWLKAQVCDHRCAYRSSTSSLKRPITVREHFRKCVYLSETHPLKVLATYELAAHERAAQGLLPNRRRSRAGRGGSVSGKTSPMPISSRLRKLPQQSTKDLSDSSEDGLSTREESMAEDASDDVSSRSGYNHATEAPPATPFEKAPRSLRGITSVAEPPSAPTMHARRHTLPDARIYGHGQAQNLYGGLFASNMSNLDYANSHSSMITEAGFFGPFQNGQYAMAEGSPLTTNTDLSGEDSPEFHNLGSDFSKQ